jgi:ornithine cyclodeaminase/alanine dehydrogenase-like protein (mu-crystallin family)
MSRWEKLGSFGRRISGSWVADSNGGVFVALFFHSDDVDQLIPFKEAVQITENALRDLVSPQGVNAPRKRLNLHRNVAEGSFDTVLNIYAGGSASYGAIGAQVALHRKAIVGNTQKRPPFNPDQTELALIYDTDSGSLLGIMAHRPRDFTGVADLRTPATSLAGLELFARKDAQRVGIYGSGQQADHSLQKPRWPGYRRYRARKEML